MEGTETGSGGRSVCEGSTVPVHGVQTKSEGRSGIKAFRMVKVNQGVRQGCTLSPWFFTVFLDTIV